MPVPLRATSCSGHHARNSGLDAGLALLPRTLGVVAGSTFAPRLIQSYGLRPVVTVAMLAATAGMLLLSGLPPGGSYAGNVLPGAVLSTLALGVGLVGSTIAAVQGVPAAQSGLASGVLNTARLMGGALGLAILGTLAAQRTGDATSAAALTDGYGLAFTIGAGFTAAGALAAATLLRKAREAALDTAAEPAAA